MAQVHLPQQRREVVMHAARHDTLAVTERAGSAELSLDFRPGADMQYALQQVQGRVASAQSSLPAGLKLSVHSGSDKFSIYPAMRRALARFNAGLHIKTAGTTWLEELIGLAESGGEGLARLAAHPHP